MEMRIMSFTSLLMCRLMIKGIFIFWIRGTLEFRNLIRLEDTFFRSAEKGKDPENSSSVRILIWTRKATFGFLILRTVEFLVLLPGEIIAIP